MRTALFWLIAQRVVAISCGNLKSRSVVTVYSVTFQITVQLLMLLQHRLLCRTEFENDRE
jgi:hypothetical protein